MTVDNINVAAVFSTDRRYRYLLSRRVSMLSARMCLFIQVNPSKADEIKDDPTVRKNIGFARRWEYGWLEVVNIFAWMATDPEDMKAADEPIGPANDIYIREAVLRADLTVCAWGNHGSYLGRSKQVMDMLRPLGKTLYCLGTNDSGEPKHPLYVPYSQELEMMS